MDENHALPCSGSLLRVDPRHFPGALCSVYISFVYSCSRTGRSCVGSKSGFSPWGFITVLFLWLTGKKGIVIHFLENNLNMTLLYLMPFYLWPRLGLFVKKSRECYQKSHSRHRKRGGCTLFMIRLCTYLVMNTNSLPTKMLLADSSKMQTHGWL